MRQSWDIKLEPSRSCGLQHVKQLPITEPPADTALATGGRTALAQHEAVGQVHVAAAATLLALGEIRAFPKSQHVWKPDDKSSFFVLVLSGQLRLWRGSCAIEMAVPGTMQGECMWAITRLSLFLGQGVAVWDHIASWHECLVGLHAAQRRCSARFHLTPSLSAREYRAGFLFMLEREESSATRRDTALISAEDSRVLVITHGILAKLKQAHVQAIPHRSTRTHERTNARTHERMLSSEPPATLAPRAACMHAPRSAHMIHWTRLVLSPSCA